MHFVMYMVCSEETFAGLFPKRGCNGQCGILAVHLPSSRVRDAFIASVK